MEEIAHIANKYVAERIMAGLSSKALLRRQAAPNPRRLQTFADRMNRIGHEIDPSSSGSLQSSLFSVKDNDIRKVCFLHSQFDIRPLTIVAQGMETLLIKAMQRAKYFVAGKVPEDLYSHYALNVPLYTHFTNPSRRYADVVVHRQLDAVLSNSPADFSEDVDSLIKTAEHCNNKKDSAMSAQEQSVHIESCRLMDKKRQSLGGDLISEGIVICVYESAFDVLLPEYGFEKRVHCDQLPLKKAEFDKANRVLELYWEKGVPSSAYIPEDERPKAESRHSRSMDNAPVEDKTANHAAKERQELQRRQTEPGTMSPDDVDALFEDDDDTTSEITEITAGVSLNPPASGERPSHSMPQSPSNDPAASEDIPHRARSVSKMTSSKAEAPEAKLTDKERYLKLFTLREENGQYIQDVKEMTRVPVLLKTDLTKSPPYATDFPVRLFAVLANGPV